MLNKPVFRPELILCPTDFSDSALVALRYAQEFARCFGSRLLVIYVDSIGAPPYFTTSQIEELVKSIKQAREAAQRHLAKYVEDRLAGAENIETEIVEGTAVSSILRIAKKRNAGLIVMGAHGMSGFNRLMLGSATKRVLHETDCPVLTVRGGDSATTIPPSITRMLCPGNDLLGRVPFYDQLSEIAARPLFRTE
ncbi:MAG: universal stress protein, partial [Nitrospirae bacterium]|nr:universal stress protein [Nitrospirota bacterium]